METLSAAKPDYGDLPEAVRGIKKRYRALDLGVPALILWEYDVRRGLFRLGQGEPDLFPEIERDAYHGLDLLEAYLTSEEIDEIRQTFTGYINGQSDYFRFRFALPKQGQAAINWTTVGAITLKTSCGKPIKLFGATCKSAVYPRQIRNLKRILRALRHIKLGPAQLQA